MEQKGLNDFTIKLPDCKTVDEVNDLRKKELKTCVDSKEKRELNNLATYEAALKTMHRYLDNNWEK